MILTEPLERRVLLAAVVNFVEDVFPGTSPGVTAGGVAFNGELFFPGANAANGRELWRSDGTPEGTKIVKDINPGSGDGAPYGLTVGGDRLYFFAQTGGFLTPYELWTTRGTTASTDKIATFDIFSPSVPVAVDDVLFFTVDTGQDPGEDLELFRVSGKSVDRVALAPSKASALLPMGTVDGKFLFRYGDIAGRDALWIMNKSGGNPHQLANLDPLGNRFVTVNDTVYFVARSNSGGRPTGLWKTDGTANGTVRVKNFGTSFSDVNSMAAVGNELYFSFSSSSPTPTSELWKTRPSLDNAERVKQFGTNDSILGITDVGGSAFFTASTPNNGRELWVSDDEGVRRVKDINPGAASGHPDNLASFNDVLYFSADDGAAGRELWTSDGTAKGTVLLQDISPGASSGVPLGSFPGAFAEVGQSLYFSATTPATGSELYRIVDNTACAGCESLAIVASADETRIVEGDTVQFTAEVTLGTATRIKWDLDGDGKFESRGDNVVHTYVDNPASGNLLIVRARANNAAGDVATDTIQLRVENGDPTAGVSFGKGVERIEGFDDQIVYAGALRKAIHFDGIVKDPGREDAIEVKWDFGDGTSTTFQPVSAGLDVDHQYAEQGVYRVRLTARDDDGGTGTSSVRLPVIEFNEEFVWGASFVSLILGNSGDNVKILPTPNPGLAGPRDAGPRTGKAKTPRQIEIVRNGNSTVVEARRVMLFTRGGDDTVTVDPAIDIPVFINGGAGNDTLRGGDANDILNGGAGNDALFGGAGKDQIAGNKGLDNLLGGPGKDKLLDQDDNDPVAALLR